MKCDICECDPCDCRWYEEDPEDTEMVYEYIYDEVREFYYVPRAPSVCEARTRATNFQKHFGEEPLIVSPQVWEMLKQKHKVLKLKED